MSDFFITDQEGQQALEDINAVTAAPQAPTDGPLEWANVIGRGWYSGLANLGAGVAREWGRSQEAIMGRAEQGGLVDPGYTQRDSVQNVLRGAEGFAADVSAFRQKDIRPRPEELSTASSIIYGVSEGLAPVIAGSTLGPLGAAGAGYLSEAERTETDLTEQGVDPVTAQGAGQRSGAFMATGALLPASIAGRLWLRMASGAGINVAAGAAQRATLQSYLTEQGYEDVAQSYQWADRDAVVIDGLMGAAFGVLPNGEAPRRPPPRERFDAEIGDTTESAPRTADEWLFDARSFANDAEPDPVEAYAHALIAKDLGAAEADGVLAAMEDDFDAADLEAGRALASEYAQSHLADELRNSGALDAAFVQQDAIHREVQTAPGIPEDSAARAAHSRALSLAEEQAATDERIDVSSTRVEEQSFVPREENDPIELEAAIRQALEESGYADRIADLEAQQERARARGIDPDMLASFGPSRRRSNTIDTDRGPITVNPSTSDMLRLTRPQLGRAKHETESLRYIVDANGDIYVANGYGMTHDDIARSVRARGLSELVGYSEHMGDAYSHGLKTGFIHRAGDQLKGVLERMLASFGQRGVGSERGSRAFHDPRLSPSENKAVEMALNNYSNAEIADELDSASRQSVNVLLSRARKKIPGLVIPAGAANPKGVVSRTGEFTATTEQLVRMRAQLLRAGYRARQAGPTPIGAKNIVATIAERYGIAPSTVRVRLFHYDRAVSQGKLEPYASVSEAPGFSSVAELENVASDFLGASWDALSAASRANIIPDWSAAPFHVPEAMQNAAAVHYQGRAYFNADRISPDYLPRLILHEIGVHHGMEDMIGKRGFNEVVRQIGVMASEMHPMAVAAELYAAKYSGNAEARRQETFAYMVEFAPDLPVVQSFLAKVRQWLVRTFGSTFGLRLTVEDIRQLALTSLRRAAKQAEREAVEVSPIYAEDALLASQRDDAGGGARGRLPQTLYHGTPEQFTEFKGPAYFADSELEASDFAGRTPRSFYEGSPEDAHLVEGAANAGRIVPISTEGLNIKVVPNNNHDFWREMAGLGHNPERIAQYKAQGFDGVRWNGQTLIFEPNGRAPNAPAVGKDGEFPLFSFGGRNAVNATGDKSSPVRYTDPALNPRFVNAVDRTRAELRESGLVAPGALGEESAVGPKGVGARGRDDQGGGRSAAEGFGSGRGNQGEGAGPIASRAQVEKLLQVSGIRIERGDPSKASHLMGGYTFSIDTPLDLDPAFARAFGSEQGKRGSTIRFDLHEKGERSMVIRWSTIDKDLRGTGAGGWLYRQAIEWGLRNGYAIKSDTSVSPLAQRIYQSLERDGYIIERNPRAVMDEDGALVGMDFKAVYTVRGGPDVALRDAAPTPRGDYQIDGPTLKDRMADVLAQRKAEEDYAAKSPEEQVLADNKDMLFSVGQNRDVSARALMDNANAERKAAEQMRSGMEAAARCGARHAAQEGARRISAVALRGYTAAAANTALAGQALGLTTSIPVGIFAAPMLARTSGQYRWAEMQTREDRLTSSAREHSRRAERAGRAARTAGRRRGELAGLDSPLQNVPMEGEPLWDVVATRRVPEVQAPPPIAPTQQTKDDFAELNDPANPPQLEPPPVEFAAEPGAQPYGKVPPAPAGFKVDE